MNKSDGKIQDHTRTYVRQRCIPVNHSTLCTLTTCSEVPVQLAVVF